MPWQPAVGWAVAALVLAGCSSSPSASEPDGNPGVPAMDLVADGALEWTRSDYDFGQLVVDDSQLLLYRYVVPVRGSVHAPEGDGPFPLLLFLHGRHSTCQYAGPSIPAVGGAGIPFTGACPNATVIEPIDSFRGYDYLAAHLASHGYVVASLDANTINDRDLAGDAGANARGRLILHTLDQFASVNATGRSLPDTPAGADVLPRVEVPRLQGRIDTSRIGLMGHSRGGEGVVRAAHLDSLEGNPHGIDAVFALAPTDFARWPVAGVAFATLLPYCDGDVTNLQGAWMYDDARRLEPVAPRHQVLAMGANHNFYNTKWDVGDWRVRGDPWCDEDEPGRDSAEGQRAHGLGLMASFFRLYVGGETGLAPFWEGRQPWPPELCPDHGSCTGRLLGSSMPLPDARIDLAPDGTPTDRDLAISACESLDCPSQPTIGRARQTAWDCSKGGTAVFRLPGSEQGVGPWSAFTLRIGPAIGGEPVQLAVTMRGGPGELAIGTVEILPPPGVAGPTDEGYMGAVKTVLSEVRFTWPTATHDQVAGASVFDVSCLGDGTIQVADVMLVR